MCHVCSHFACRCWGCMLAYWLRNAGVAKVANPPRLWQWSTRVTTLFYGGGRTSLAATCKDQRAVVTLIPVFSTARGIYLNASFYKRVVERINLFQPSSCKVIIMKRINSKAHLMEKKSIVVKNVYFEYWINWKERNFNKILNNWLHQKLNKRNTIKFLLSFGFL